MELRAHQEHAAWNKISYLFIDHSTACGKVHVETLKEQFEPLLLKKHEVENRAQSMLKTFYAFFDYQDYNTGKKIDIFSIDKFLSAVESFQLRPWWNTSSL